MQGPIPDEQNEGTEWGTASEARLMKVTVMGPPGSGKTTMLQLLSEHYGLTPIKTGEIVIDHALQLNGQNESEDQSMVGQKLRDFFYQKKDKTHRPPIELVMPLITEHVRKVELANPRGWVMERGVREPDHFEAFSKAGLLPDLVVVLEADAETVNKRLQGRRVDRTLDRVYSVNSDTSPALKPRNQKVLARLQKRKHDDPEDAARRTRRYRAEAYQVCPLYPEGRVHQFDAARPIRELLPEVLQWLDSFYHLESA